MPATCPVHLTPGSRSWPGELGNIDAPPAELWARGDLALFEAGPRVAIVGSRAPTGYGLAQAERFARRLAEAGAVIVSGLARGVDETAHAAALAARGGTIAVLGGGVDRPWPAGPLAERIAREGLLLSELPPGAPPRRHHFPRRNRLISGLSRAVVVIEAAWASGSLITARWAADQGRAVFALPGRVDHPMARGTHRLIREGATLVEDPAEVLMELGLGAEARTARREHEMARTARREHEMARAAASESPLLAALVGETLDADELAERLGGDVGAVLTELVERELEGRVVRGPGGLYRLA